jgi:cell division protein FtsQ
VSDLLHRRTDASAGDPSSTPPEERTRRRFLRRARARRWRTWRRVLLGLLVVGAAAGLVWLVFFSSVLAVKGARVDGTAVLSAREVQRVAQVPTGVPLATADLDAVEARVEELAAVLDADVSRSWPDQVLIAVTERTAVVAVEREGTWKGVDEEGVVFRDFPRRPPGLPVVEMQADTSSAALAEAALVVEALPADVLRRTTSLDVRSIDSIELRLQGGVTVSWGSADQAADKARVLEVLLRQEGTRYDVTAPGRPTVRP